MKKNKIGKIKNMSNQSLILDNTIKDNNNFIVFDRIKENVSKGKINIVTGYFTVGALVEFVKITENLIDNYKIILGDITNITEPNETLNLLNEDILIDKAISLRTKSNLAIKFLQQDNVKLKTLEPNFCHAKLYVYKDNKNSKNSFFISGSSNLTEAGLGIKSNSNIELNLYLSGENLHFNEIYTWFDKLWNSEKAHLNKTISKGKTKKSVEFKEYVIEQISKLFKDYTPEEIYNKMLFELFNNPFDDEDTKKQIKNLKDSVIYNKLFEFQKSAVDSLLFTLEKYNGAILADAVGLGKTWTALAIMKSYEIKGYKVVVFCPKKLQYNWEQYRKNSDSIFEEDEFEYVVRYHTDLREDGLERNGITQSFFTSKKSKLYVIDESHNLRNDKSQRYNYLVNEVLTKSKGEVKVLLLSATPINNSFKDIRNQFKLLAKGNDKGFEESLDVSSLEYTFRKIQEEFDKWRKIENSKLYNFLQNIDNNIEFKNLTDKLLFARTRRNIKSIYKTQQNGVKLEFPDHEKPENHFITPIEFGEIKTFDDLLKKLKVFKSENEDLESDNDEMLKLSVYQPSYYTFSEEEREERANKKKGTKEDILKDNVNREFYLTKMIVILLIKRLESSWVALYKTLKRIAEQHVNVLAKIDNYINTKDNNIIVDDLDEDDRKEIEEEIDLNQYTVGKKSPIALSLIDNKGMLHIFKEDIASDLNILNEVISALDLFKNEITVETSNVSKDKKLEKLIQIIKEKQTKSNKKVIIFTAYEDTGNYLFDEFKKRKLNKFLLASGSGVKFDNKEYLEKKINPALENFAPFTKLYKEKKWEDYNDFIKSNKINDDYKTWKEWIINNDKVTSNKLNNEYDILIATDVLSEGQNLQDSDLLINFDIHWNPVRVIQRLGRIDRIGSPNQLIKSINFWPSLDIDKYIDLKGRVEKRMSMMKLAGSEVIERFTDSFEEIIKDEKIEEQENAKILRQMMNKVDDIEEFDNTIGLNDFSINNYKQMLNNILKENQNFYKELPNGIYSGIKINSKYSDGLVLLLGYPTKKNKEIKEYDEKKLIYINFESQTVSTNQQMILDLLLKYRQSTRLENDFMKLVDSGDSETINSLSSNIKNWISNGSETKTDIIETLRNKPNDLFKDVANYNSNSNPIVEQKEDPNNYDLITWMIINN